MKRYIVYCHTLNGKKYVGYTGKTLDERLNDHIAEAAAGSDRHFCRAIRKYGIDNIISEELHISENKNEAKRKEREFIKKLKTFTMGYNMTHGGTGGNTIEKYSSERLAEHKKLKSNRSSGMCNGNAKPTITKGMVIETIVAYVIHHNLCGNYLLRKEIEYVLDTELNVSFAILRNRFARGLCELIELVNAKLYLLDMVGVMYNPHHRSETQKKLLSRAAAMNRWVTNGIQDLQIKESELGLFLKENTRFRNGRTKC